HVVVPQGYARRDLAAPAVLGLRPGYIYRVELDNFATRPGVRLFPTLEVRGSLVLPPLVSAAKFPAPVVLSEADIDAVMAGGLVPKGVYLECPDHALPRAFAPGETLESDVSPWEDLLLRSRDYGRPVLVLRVGQKQLSNEELAWGVVPGTVLLPGERMLPQAV